MTFFFIFFYYYFFFLLFNFFARADRFMLIDLNSDATNSNCVAFTPKLYKLAVPSLHINHLSISYTNSLKYLGRICACSDNSDDAEKLKQLKLLYCRSYRLIRMFNKCSQNVLIKLSRRFCTIIYFSYFMRK